MVHWSRRVCMQASTIKMKDSQIRKSNSPNRKAIWAMSAYRNMQCRNMLVPRATLPTNALCTSAHQRTAKRCCFDSLILFGPPFYRYIRRSEQKSFRTFREILPHAIRASSFCKIRLICVPSCIDRNVFIKPNDKNSQELTTEPKHNSFCS